MEKLIFTAVILGAAILPLSFVLAIDYPNPLDVDTFEELLEAIINFVFWVGMALAPLMITIAGFMYVTSIGSSDKMTKAKDLLIWTLVGVAVLLSAKGLVNVIESILGI